MLRAGQYPRSGVSWGRGGEGEWSLFLIFKVGRYGLQVDDENLELLFSDQFCLVVGKEDCCVKCYVGDPPGKGGGGVVYCLSRCLGREVGLGYSNPDPVLDRNLY